MMTFLLLVLVWCGGCAVGYFVGHGDGRRWPNHDEPDVLERAS
jgi:hypothetical protein